MLSVQNYFNSKMEQIKNKPVQFPTKKEKQTLKPADLDMVNGIGYIYIQYHMHREYIRCGILNLHCSYPFLIFNFPDHLLF